MATATLTIPPQAEQVRTARLVTTAAARRCGVSEDRIDEIRLAVGEVIARSVLRQQRAGLPDPVVVDITDDDELFTVRVQEATGPRTSATTTVALALSVVARWPSSAIFAQLEPAARSAWPGRSSATSWASSSRLVRPDRTGLLHVPDRRWQRRIPRSGAECDLDHTRPPTLKTPDAARDATSRA